MAFYLEARNYALTINAKMNLQWSGGTNRSLQVVKKFCKDVYAFFFFLMANLIWCAPKANKLNFFVAYFFNALLNLL